MVRAWASVATVSLVLTMYASPASAQDATASAADALFESGKAAMTSHEYERACSRFHESFRLQAMAGTLLNLAACEQARGRPSVALQCYRDARSMLEPSDYRVPYATERIAEVQQQVAQVRVHVPGVVPAGLQVARDGVAIGAAALEVAFAVDPGDHEFTATAPGFAPARVRVRVAAGESHELLLPLHAARAVAPPASRPQDALAKPRPAPASVGVVLLSSGAAAVLVGAAFGGVVALAAADVREHCEGSVCDDAGLEAARRGRPFAVLSPVLLVSGAAAAGAGLIWLRLSRAARVRPRASSKASWGLELTVHF